METRCSSMKRINKGTWLICKRGMWAESPVRLRWKIALTVPSLRSYEPLLGENRELGEKRDSTLRTNARLI